MSISTSPSSLLPDWQQPQRKALFDSWLGRVAASHALNQDSLRIASADASFRRYFRIDSASGSRIIMDAPPELENSQPFVDIAQLFRDAGIKVPEILDWDQASGFMLLSDLGAHTLMQSLAPDALPPLEAFELATDILVRWQLASRSGVLPAYDAAMLAREMQLYPQWYVAEHRQITLDAAQTRVLQDAIATITQETLQSPSVFVHRDFMARNLMVDTGGLARLREQGLGVIDFQGAAFGPITYDIASLLRDAFISWDEDVCLNVTIRYWQKARKAGLPVGDDFGAFYRAVEWMGLQRHLKVAGIFARLSLRDGKPQYLADTPRFIAYIRHTCARYRELKPLLRLVEKIDGIEVPNAFAFGRV